MNIYMKIGTALFAVGIFGAMATVQFELGPVMMVICAVLCFAGFFTLFFLDLIVNALKKDTK